MIKENEVLFDLCCEEYLKVNRIIENDVFVTYDNGLEIVFNLDRANKAILDGILIKPKGMY